MTTSVENSLIDAALRGWKSNIERAGNLFGTLSPEQLEQQVAPGKNRLIYLWGHLTAVNDGLLPLLGIGERLHPEFDGMFISNPDKSVPLTVSGQSLKTAWQEINQKLWDGFSRFSASDWAQRHTAVSEEDFAREPHRNRFTVLLGVEPLPNIRDGILVERGVKIMRYVSDMRRREYVVEGPEGVIRGQRLNVEYVD